MIDLIYLLIRMYRQDDSLFKYCYLHNLIQLAGCNAGSECDDCFARRAMVINNSIKAYR